MSGRASGGFVEGIGSAIWTGQASIPLLLPCSVKYIWRTAHCQHLLTWLECSAISRSHLLLTVLHPSASRWVMLHSGSVCGARQSAGGGEMEGRFRLPRIGARSWRRWRRSEVKTSNRSLRSYAVGRFRWRGLAKCAPCHAAILPGRNTLNVPLGRFCAFGISGYINLSTRESAGPYVILRDESLAHRPRTPGPCIVKRQNPRVAFPAGWQTFGDVRL